MFRFENVDYLYGLLLIPFFIGLFYFVRMNRRHLLRKYGDLEIIKRLFPETSKYKPFIKFSLFLSGLAFLVIGIANPQIGTKLQEVKREGVEVVIAIDISNSMLAEDLKPNRLARAKQSVMRLIDNLQTDRIGIVVFAGDAFLQLPLTTDYSAAKMLVSTIETELISTQGTAIGKAIELSMASFSQKDEKQKALIIITDGENHEDDALSMAAKAATEGIFVHTIGMGSDKGAPIPKKGGRGKSNFIQDREGNFVLSKLNAQMLQQIAAAGNGNFERASSDLTPIVEKIAKMEKTEFETKVYTDYEDRFQYFLAVAFLLFMIEMMLSESKNKVLTALNLFGGNKK